VDIYTCRIRYVSNGFLDYIRRVSNGFLDQSGSPSFFLGILCRIICPQARVLVLICAWAADMQVIKADSIANIFATGHFMQHFLWRTLNSPQNGCPVDPSLLGRILRRVPLDAGR